MIYCCSCPIYIHAPVSVCIVYVCIVFDSSKPLQVEMTIMEMIIFRVSYRLGKLGSPHGSNHSASQTMTNETDRPPPGTTAKLGNVNETARVLTTQLMTLTSSL
jgi:hypothetical protein